MIQEPYTILFIGPQGSGKGTQIELLSKVLKTVDPERRAVDIQTGRRFRALSAKSEGYTERKIHETLDSGILQPLFLSVALWGDAFHHHVDSECHILIDGFPRVIPEAEVLESALSFYERGHLTIVNLETSDDIVRERMIKRARPDDTSDSIEARLVGYQTETLPVLAYYKERMHTTIVNCDGDRTIEEVHAEILKAIALDTK